MPTDVAMMSVCHCCHANQCGDGVLQLCDVQLNELNKMIHEAGLHHCVVSSTRLSHVEFRLSFYSACHFFIILCILI